MPVSHVHPLVSHSAVFCMVRSFVWSNAICDSSGFLLYVLMMAVYALAQQTELCSICRVLYVF